jgi:hypothetical protein
MLHLFPGFSGHPTHHLPGAAAPHVRTIRSSRPADLQSTPRYLHSDTRTKQAAVERLPALSAGAAASQWGGGPG